MPRDLPLRQSSGCMGGDLSAVIASASRRPRVSTCLVKVDSRSVQIATPAFQSTPRFATSPPPVIRCLINDFEKIVGHLTLSRKSHTRLVANLLSLIPIVIPRCPAKGRTSIKSGTLLLCLSTKATEDDHPIPTAHSQRD